MTVTLAHFVEKTARLYPNDLAITCEDRTLDWATLWERICALAGGFQALGLRRGERVAYLGLNSEWFYECYHAPSLAGLELVALNFRASEAELRECLKDAAPTLLICDAGHEALGRAAAEGSSVREVLITGAGGSYERLIARDHKVTGPPSSNEDTLIIYFTGGTTGRAKGVELSHWNIYSNAVGSLSSYNFLPFETHLLIGPMFHTAAGARAFTCPVLPAHLILMPKFDVETCLRLIQDCGVHVVQFVPTMMQRILEHPSFGSYDMSSLRQVTLGASPTPRDVFERVYEAFPGVNILNGYGATETAPLISAYGSHMPEFQRSKLSCAGPSVPHGEIAIRAPSGSELPKGEIGEITVRGPHVMKGYLGQPAATQAAIRDGWYYTGDAGYLDEDACLWISGRIKDMIISGGENIYPIEIENHLSRHPDVSEVAVIGLPDAEWGERVEAVVILRDGAVEDAQALIDYCRASLTTYKCPRGVIFRSEPMPLSGANKILKTALREEYAS